MFKAKFELDVKLPDAIAVISLVIGIISLVLAVVGL